MADIGDRGELLLSSWCTEVDLIANRSVKDVTGWDHLIEFPLNQAFSNDELHQSPPQCKIQVKATNGNKRKVPISLSNLQRMVTDPLPYFILYIEYNGLIPPQKAFLKYVDKTLISKVLKKIHTINQSEKENKLNKKTMSISFTELDKLSEFSGECLKKSLVDHIGPNFEISLLLKQEILSTIGYEDGKLLGTLITKGEDNLNKMIDISLGIEGSVEVEEFSTYEQRFGIKNRKAMFSDKDLTAGMLSMPNIQPNDQVIVSFKSHPLKQPVEFKADIYFSPLVKGIEDEYFRYRLVFSFGEAMFYHNQQSCTITYGFDTREYDIWECQAALKLIISMIEGAQYSLSIKLKNETSSYGVVSINESKDCNLEILKHDLCLVISAILLLDDAEVRGPVKVSISNLRTQKKAIHGFADLIHGNNTETIVNFKMNSGSIDENKEVTFIGITTLQLGEFLLSYFYSVKSIPKLKDDGFVMLQSRPHIEEKIICKETDVIESQDIEDLLLTIKEKQKDPSQVVHPLLESNINNS